MKKTLSVIILCIAAVLALAGCGQKNTKSNEYDEVIINGGGYEIVTKWTDSFEKSGNMIGVLKDGKWLYPLSDNNIFLEHRYLQERRGIRNTANFDDFQYCSDGMFRIENYFYDVYNNTGCVLENKYELSPAYIRAINFEDEYTVVNARENSDWGIYKLSRDGEMTDMELDGGIACKYSNGLFYCDGYFYDINGNKKIDITDLTSKYKICAVNGNNDDGLCFAQDGKCYIYTVNDGGTTYRVVLHKDGSREEPQKADGTSGLSYISSPNS